MNQHQQGHDHGMNPMMMTPSPSSSPSNMMNNIHMTFYWGKNAEILFSGWPGSNSGLMYTASLLVVFLLAFFLECMSRIRCLRPGTTNDVVFGLVQTLLHALRVGLAYLVMLALMSFNGGVFLVAVAGHALGFLVSGTRVFGLGLDDPNLPPYKKASDLPSTSC